MSDAIYATSVTFKTLTNGELRAQIEVDKNYAAEYMKTFIDPGTPMGIALISNQAAITEDNKPNNRNPKKGQYGDYAKRLRQSSFFDLPLYGKQLGAIKNLGNGYRKQPSCVSHQFDQSVNGEPRNIAAHVRRSDESGTGFKAEYACVPLTQGEHEIQHQQGEMELLKAHYPYELWDEEKAKLWFDRNRVDFVQQWSWNMFKEKCGQESMSQVSRETALEVARQLGVEDLLP